METFYYAAAILASGIALAIGLISLLTFLHKSGKKIDLFFSLLCLSVVIFILLPPSGFILLDTVPYPTNINVKQLFSFSFIAMLPWFISLYTGYKPKLVPFLVTLSIVISYILMIGTSTRSTDKVWIATASSILAVIIAHGFYAGFRQYKTERPKALCLFVALVVFTVLNVFGAINQLSNDNLTGDWTAIFFPFNLCPLAFILIIGIQLQANPDKQYHLEKILGLRESRWQSMLEEIQLVIINTDIAGRIKYINRYGLNLLGYKDASELIDTNWSDHCLSVPGNSGNKTGFDGMVVPNGVITKNKNAVLTKDKKEKIINWTSDLLYNDNGDLMGRMSIGSDITKQEEALQQVQQLKAELEKENLEQHEDIIPTGMHQEVVGKSRPFIYAIQKSKQVAPTNASVLLLGETGVGKEAFADLIQETSLRSKMPFVKVNCGALPAELIEDELFGHEKGAFTGAIQSRMGRFEKANGGTIFLDEIGELPLVLQPKLLRVLQNGEFERVGGHQTIKVDVRVIAATNSDLEKEVKENRFRDDLFYRLNVFPITIPPLRKRNADIPLLIQYFIEKKSKKHGKRFENISKADMNRLCDYEWPGNIRELKNVIERAVISSDNHTLKLDWFHQHIETNKTETASTNSLEQVETAYILKVLQECNWKINGENGAAEKLVMHPNTLRSRMKKLKIAVPWKHDTV
ncbi:sigma 54-interacting transcriptional regulator [Flavitalea sp.]|nr:sigma 54-interacting transcriptional regulator [Flavitalea sp.]